jgi:hypothetical protein
MSYVKDTKETNQRYWTNEYQQWRDPGRCQSYGVNTENAKSALGLEN